MPAFNNSLCYYGLLFTNDKQAKEWVFYIIISLWFCSPNFNRFLKGTTYVLYISRSTSVQFNAPTLLLSRLLAPIKALVKGVINSLKVSIKININNKGLFYYFY